MSEPGNNLREEFKDKDYRHGYADESLSTYIATQIKVLREQRKLTQKELGEATGMAQPRIHLLENINYSAWSINTLRRLAKAFDLRLSVKFETFSSLILEVASFSRAVLERKPFDEDPWFHNRETQSSGLPALGSVEPKKKDTVVMPGFWGLSGSTTIAGDSSWNNAVKLAQPQATLLGPRPVKAAMQ